MFRFVWGALLALTIIPSTGSAQDYAAGLAAAHSGDFATALHEWTPLAEQGNAGAQYNIGLMYRRSEQAYPQCGFLPH